MKKDIRIISLDLDGTLLDSQKRLSDANRAALEEAAAKGVHIVPTTGRFFGMMPQAVRDLPFVRYAITINGAQVYAIGNSRGDGLCIVEGIVSDVLRIVDSKQYFMTSAIVTNGNSGCPVFGADGNLLGMITEGSKYSVAMNYAIPSAILLDYVQKTEASKNITIL